MSAPKQYETQVPAPFGATEARLLCQVGQVELFMGPWCGCLCAGETEIARPDTNRYANQHALEVIE